MSYDIVKAESAEMNEAIRRLRTDIDKLKLERWHPIPGSFQALVIPLASGKVRYILLQAVERRLPDDSILTLDKHQKVR